MKLRDLEHTVLNYLCYLPHDELRAYTDKLLVEEWTVDNRTIVTALVDYAKLEADQVQGGSFNWLQAALDDPRLMPLVVKIQGDFTPTPLGIKAFKKLSDIQEERRYKRTVKETLELPLAEIKPKLHELLQAPISAFKPRSLAETGVERVQERKLEAVAPSTGYSTLDMYIKGFIPGHSLVLTGDTNAGKTTMCCNFAHRVARQGKKVLYFALEPENTIVDYLASIRMRKAFASLTEADILQDDPNISIFGKDQIRQAEDLVKAIHSLPRYDFIVIDHIGYFTSNTANMVSRQSDVMKYIAGLAKSRQSAIMLIQHLNKSKKDKGSPENNITGSAAFKQDATDVLMLVRDTEEDSFGATVNLPTGSILIRKSKSDNPQGSVPIRFIEGSALILDGNDQVQRF